MKKIVKYILLVLSISLVSCTNKETVPTYIPVKEITDPYDLEGKETIVIKNIEMPAKSFINTVTNDTVKVLHHLDKTGFHFYNAVAFKSEKEGVIAGGTGLRVRTTTDGGLHWQENQFSKFANAFHAVAINKGNIFVVGESQFIYKSSDFGKNWKVLDTDKLIENTDKTTQKFYGSFNARFYKVKFHNTNTGIIIGDYNKTAKSKPILLKTTDAGQNWTIPILNGLKDTETGISDLVILSEKIIFMVTLSGSCYKSIDGGTNWKLLFNDSNLSLNSIDFLNENEGYIGGMENTLLYTKDGGKIWNTVDLKLSSYLNVSNIMFLNKQKAFISVASQSGELKADLVYEMDNHTKELKSILSKKDTSQTFKGETYGLYQLNNYIYILDRDKLFRKKIIY